MIVPMQPPPPGVDADVHRAIYEAIGTLHTAEIEDPVGRKRIGEPHDYGMLNGKPILLFFQTFGYSKSGNLPQWRHLDARTSRALRPPERPFNGGRDLKSSRNRQWHDLFTRARQS